MKVCMQGCVLQHIFIHLFIYELMSKCEVLTTDSNILEPDLSTICDVLTSFFPFLFFLDQSYCDRLQQDMAFLTSNGRLSEQLVDKIILQLNRVYPQILTNKEAEKVIKSVGLLDVFSFVDTGLWLRLPVSKKKLVSGWGQRKLSPACANYVFPTHTWYPLPIGITPVPNTIVI